MVQKADLTDSPNLNDHIALIKNSILYDSKNFVVINKPPNYAVHGGSGLNFGVIEIIRKIYKSKVIKERHRHRYEVNISYKEKFEKKGLIFSGISPDDKLPEIIELKNHPWFIGVQFHPEFKSRPFNPHPLFSSFIKAAKKRYAK